MAVPRFRAQRAVRAYVRGAARARAALPTAANCAPRANVGARSAIVASGQLNVSGSVPRKPAPLLNALGSSLPAGQKRERERRPERPRRARLHAHGALCANAVHARVVLAERRRSRKRGGERRRPRRSLSEAAVKKCGVAFPRPRLNGSAFGAVHQPVRNALGGTGSLRSRRPENANACESRWFGESSRDALSDSHRPATNAGPSATGAPTLAVGARSRRRVAQGPSAGRLATRVKRGAVTPARTSPRRSRSR